MNEETKKYYIELSEKFIMITLDYNTLEKRLQEIEEIINSRCKSDTKIKKLKELFESYHETQKSRETE